MERTNFINIQLHAQKPTDEEMTAAIIAAGATAEQAAASVASISAMLSNSPQGNDYLTEFNNAVIQRWNDVHGDRTIYDRFKRKQDAPTLQAVVYERIASVDFNYKTEISSLPTNEQCNTRKTPAIHSIFKSLNLQRRFKTTTSKHEIDKIQDGQAVSVNDVVANLASSYADERVEQFIALVDGIDSNKTKDEINTMATLADVSKFIQLVKYYTLKFKEKRTDKYNAFKIQGDATAKADTKMYPDDKPIVFIDAQRMYQIEGDYYSTLMQLKQALPDVEFVEIDGLTGNKFAVMVDPRVVEWGVYMYELRAEQICGRPAGDLNHYLFTEETMGSWTCFNRVIFRTAAVTG